MKRGGPATRLIATFGSALLLCAACRETVLPPRATAGHGAGGAAGKGAAGKGAAGSAGSAGGASGASAGGGASAGSGGAGVGGAGAGGAAGQAEAGSGGSRALPEPDVDAILERGCAKTQEQSDLLPSNLLFVIDRSSSMACNPPPVTDSQTCELNPERADILKASKWEIMRDKLRAAIRALPADTVVGISYFSNDDVCGVQSTPNVELARLEPAQRGVINVSLGEVEPNGSTPLVGATILAYSHLHAGALEGKLSGNSFVVLLTDGEQSDACTDNGRCADKEQCTELLVDKEAPKARGTGVGIRTFVIGAPGSEAARVMLSELAVAGGTALPGCDAALGNCHFDMTSEDDFDSALASALNAISGRALSCELLIPQPPAGEFDPTRVNVVYSPADRSAPRVVPQDSRLGCDDGANGWQYIEDNTKIRLCGQACRTVAADRGARLDVVLGCAVRGPD